MNQNIDVGNKVVDFFEEKKKGTVDEILEYVKLNNENFPMFNNDMIDAYALKAIELLSAGMLISKNKENEYERIF